MESRIQSQLDPLDLSILAELQQDARIAFSRLAEKLKVSNSLVHQRVRRLRESGILKDASFEISPESMGFETCAYCQIMIDHPRYMDSVIDALREIPEIVECVNIAGRYAIMVKVYTYHNRHLRDVVYEKIQPIEGVEGTNTVVSFETPFRRGLALNIDIP